MDHKDPRPDSKPLLVGVISDTHGWLHPRVLRVFEGVDLIVHAGDIGSAEILERLRVVAPVHAVRGNTDHSDWCEVLPERLELEVGACPILVLHNGDSLGREALTKRYAVIISGHSHVASQEERQGMLFFNPGTAGAARPGRPFTVGLLRLCGGHVQSEIVALEV